MRAIVAVAALGLMFVSPKAMANCFTEAAASAKDFCGDLEDSGYSLTGDGKIDASAATSKYFRKFAGGVSGSINGEAKFKKFQSVVQEDLSADRFDVRKCRQNTLKLAVEIFCSKSEGHGVDPSSGPGIDSTPASGPPHDEFTLTKGGHIFLTDQRILVVLTGYTGVSQDRGQGIFITIGGQPTIMYPGVDIKVPLHIGPCRMSLITAVVNGSTSFQTDCSIQRS